MPESRFKPIEIHGHRYSGSQIFTSTVVAASGTITSLSFDISKVETKTIASYITALNNNSTLIIQVNPLPTGTFLNYYSTNISSTLLNTSSIIGAFNLMRVQYISGTLSSTIDSWVNLQY